MLSFTRSEWFPTSRKDFLYVVRAKKQQKIIHTILQVKFRCPSDTILPVEFRCSRSRGASDSQHPEKDFLYAVHAKKQRKIIHTILPVKFRCPYHSTGGISMLSFTRSEWFPTFRKDFLYAVHAKKQRKLSIPFYRWHSDALVHAERVIPNIQKRFPVCSAC